MIDHPKFITGINLQQSDQKPMSTNADLKSSDAKLNTTNYPPSPQENRNENLVRSGDKKFTPKDYIQQGKLKRFNIDDLLLHFEHKKSSADTNLQNCTQSWQQIPLSILMIDMRQPQDFAETYIKGSINPVFPMLLTKRFKKRMFSNFNLLNFLPDVKCQDTFNNWKQSTNGRKCILVYNDSMSESNFDQDVWYFLACLVDGMANEICANNQPLVAYLSSGISNLIKNDKLRAYLDGTSMTNLEQLTISPTQDHPMEDVEVSKTPPPPLVSRDTIKAPTRKPTLNLIIGGGGSAGVIGKKEKPKLNKEIITNQPMEDSPLTSPNDNAAPPEPFSRITKNIFVGSDLLPLAIDGPKQLMDIGITHILNMAAEIKNSQIVEDCGLFQLKWIPVMDNTEVDMDDALQDAIDFIGGAVKENPDAVVFVHCKAGRSRSVSAVIGYLVSVEKYTLKTAYDLVRKVRKGVSPNLGFMAALLKVEKDTHGENSRIADLYA
ncbi:Dual specificity protein phosphatase 9 [Globomyces sp. JEL0801]|nr:Dual specificity protein phosphatase 9 [Globomyces sp. JEL0801]